MKKFGVSIFILILLFSTTTFASGDRVSLGYIYNSYKSHTEIIDDTNGNINTVSPTCFDLTSSGHLEINNIFDQEFVNEMHERGVMVTPFLSNHWGRKRAQNALNKPEVLADEIVEAIEKYNLDGVNVDLENLTANDKDRLTNFVRVLREKLGDSKIISVAVASNPNKLQKTWVAAYDYAGLAEYADYLVLMAYDEHSAGGSAGPVASINFVKNSIEVMLEEVSRDKIVLGMPLYGRVWGEGKDYGGEAIILSQIERIAKRYNAVAIFDEVTGTPTITIDVESGDHKAYVNGKYLEEGRYTIWYENEKSFSKKLELMNEFGLKGAALWALDNENDDFWNWYEKGFNVENYESEEAANERAYYEYQRAYYEYVEMLIENAEPLKLDCKIELKNSKIEVKKVDISVLMKTKIIEDLKVEEVSYPPLDQSTGKVIVANEHTKRTVKVSNNHHIKRYEKTY